MAQDGRTTSDFAFARGLVVALGAILGIAIGGWIAEESWLPVGIALCILIGVCLILNLRHNWWVLIPWMSALGVSSVAPGFNLTGVDAAALLGFATLGFRRALGDLKLARPSLRLSWVFFALVFFVLAHALIVIVYQHYEGGTQLKNVIKAYYQIAAPLLLLWLLALYATPSSVGVAVRGILLISVPTFSGGCLLVSLQRDLPLLSHPFLSFDWAGALAFGHIRWSAISLLLLALCLSTAARSGLAKTACFLIAVLALAGAFLGGGRVAFASCLLGIALWMGLRRNLLAFALAASLVFAALAAINLEPRVLQDLPKSVQRSLTPFVFSDEKTEEQMATEGSDRWHQDLRRESVDYWMESPMSIALGHGYKGWNDSIDASTFTEGPLYESAKKIAIQMGRTERSFNSILVIFGAAGVLLYYGFMLDLALRLWRLRLASPTASFSKAMCEFSLCMILISLATAFHAGGVPSFGMIYWVFGLLAAREFASPASSERPVRGRRSPAIDPLPAFTLPARSQAR